jgi:uncharacterized membrane protein
MNRQRIEAVALGLIAVFMLPVGLQATFAPQSFFDDFPLGRGWVSHTGDAYNEHLVRDVGALFLALIIVTGWTVLRRLPARPVAVAWLVQGVLHLTYHAGHLDGYDTADKIGLVGSLVTVPVLALVALWAGRSSPATASQGGATPSP